MDALISLINGDPKQILEKFLAPRSARSLWTMNEATLQAIVEASWADDHTQCLPALLLDTHPGHDFVDLFVVRRPKTSSTAPSILVIELKNISLFALWVGQSDPGNLGDEPILTGSKMEEFRKQLLAETEDTLLERKYYYWDLSAKCWQAETLLTLKKGALYQLTKYMNYIQQGPSSEGSAGIFDNRVSCKEGVDSLRGYVVMCIGGTRVFAWGRGMMRTKWTYSTSDVTTSSWRTRV